MTFAFVIEPDKVVARFNRGFVGIFKTAEDRENQGVLFGEAMKMTQVGLSGNIDDRFYLA